MADTQHLKPKGPRSWELGNDILCKLCDEAAELESECRASHPDVAAILNKIRHKLGKVANDLMEHGGCRARMAPESGDETEKKAHRKQTPAKKAPVLKLSRQKPKSL